MDVKPKRGGRREPPGGRPRKDNVRLVCYVRPKTLENIKWLAGEGLTLGEAVDSVVDHAMPESRKLPAIESGIDSCGAPSDQQQSG